MNNHCGKSKLHKILMILCCTVPIFIIGILYLTNVQGTAWGSILSFGAILLCPLMHMVVMPLMHGRKEDEAGENKASCH